VTGGRVASLNVSAGGVPKLPVPSAEVTPEGVAGDRQRNRKHHGGPDRALCLWSLERIHALQGEGHPVAPGSTGENVTVAGIDWASVVPGVRLRIGPVLAAVTAYTTPCRTIARSFAWGRSGRVSQRTHPGWSRVYARVIEAGRVTEGDPVVLVDA
jgi:MOSC domain-containing protein YiiM